jgi:hypothetical protein
LIILEKSITNIRARYLYDSLFVSTRLVGGFV